MVDSPFEKDGINPFEKQSKEKIKWRIPEVKPSENIKLSVESTKPETEHAKILREHGGLESNIPIHHHYWRIRP